MKLRRVSVRDRPDMIGGEALSFLAPATWVVEGGIVWRPIPAMPAAVALRVRDPATRQQVEIFPTGSSIFGGVAGSLYPVGSLLYGSEVLPPVPDAIQYIEQRLLPRARGAFRPTVVSRRPLPDVAEAVRTSEPNLLALGAIVSAGRVRVAYAVEGQPVEEDFYAVLSTIGTGAQVAQTADPLYAMRAEKGRLDAATCVLQTMISSSRFDLRWYGQLLQVARTLTQIELDRIKTAGDISRIISRTQGEIGGMAQRTYDQRNASQDRIARSWSRVTRGVDEYVGSSGAVELPSGYGRAWANGRGEYVVTDSVSFNPNVELGGAWQPLERRP